MAVESDGDVESAAGADPSPTGGGRHRLPRAERGPAGAAAAPVNGPSADDTAGFDEESGSTHCEPADDVDNEGDGNAASVTSAPLSGRAMRVTAFGVLPALTVILGGGAGYLTWTTISANFLQQARVESVRAATEGAAALLTYHADSVDRDLRTARERLTGRFKTSYTAYTHHVVIPDAHRKHISAVATVPAAASVWTTTNQAVVMVFVNQTFNSDLDPPTATASSVRVTLDKVGGRWLISDFTPV